LGLTATFVEAVPVQPLLYVTVTLYTPALAGVMLGMIGFCCVDEPAGPLHA